jgi:hypothetical protein
MNEQQTFFWKQRRKAMVALSQQQSLLVTYAGFRKRGGDDVEGHDVVAFDVAEDEDEGLDGGTATSSTAAASAASSSSSAATAKPAAAAATTVGAPVAIDYSKYDHITVSRSGPKAEDAPAITAFGDIRARCPTQVWSNLQRMGYSRPTPVQQHAIPLAFDGRDVMCCAETGSGKTCAFLLPAVCALLQQQQQQQQNGEGDGGSGKVSSVSSTTTGSPFVHTCGWGGGGGVGNSAVVDRSAGGMQCQRVFIRAPSPPLAPHPPHPPPYATSRPTSSQRHRPSTDHACLCQTVAPNMLTR